MHYDGQVTVVGICLQWLEYECHACSHGGRYKADLTKLQAKGEYKIQRITLVTYFWPPNSIS